MAFIKNVVTMASHNSNSKTPSFLMMPLDTTTNYLQLHVLSPIFPAHLFLLYIILQTYQYREMIVILHALIYTT